MTRRRIGKGRRGRRRGRLPGSLQDRSSQISNSSQPTSRTLRIQNVPSWMEVIEFARDLVSHVLLMNLIVWEDRFFSAYRTPRPAYTESMKIMVRFATLAHSHNWATAWKNATATFNRYRDLNEDFGYEEFEWECLDLCKDEEKPSNQKFLSNCTAISYLAIERFRENEILAPYYAVIVIVDYVRKLCESGNLPDALADR